MLPIIDCNTVAELIEALKQFPPGAVPIAASPPFTGVRLIPQNDGNVLIVEAKANVEEANVVKFFNSVHEDSKTVEVY